MTKLQHNKIIPLIFTELFVFSFTKAFNLVLVILQLVHSVLNYVKEAAERRRKLFSCIMKNNQMENKGNEASG